MIRAPEDWQAKWLEIQRSRVSIATLLGWLDRWIKRRIREATSEQLLGAEAELFTLSKIVSDKLASPGKRYLEWIGHPLHRLLFEERVRREIEKGLEPNYLGSLSTLSDDDLKRYLIWKGDKHGSVQEWRKSLKRSLPVIPSDPVGDEQKANPNNSRLLGSRARDPIGETHRSDHLQGPTPQAKENRAYGPPRKKRS